MLRAVIMHGARENQRQACSSDSLRSECETARGAGKATARKPCGDKVISALSIRRVVARIPIHIT